MTTTTTQGPHFFTDAALIYAADSRCPCGAGLAYPRHVGPRGYWDCADILTGRAVPGEKEHTAKLPFTFYEVKSEQQPSASGRTTRPHPLTEREQAERAHADVTAKCAALDRTIFTLEIDTRQAKADYNRESAKRAALAVTLYGVEVGHMPYPDAELPLPRTEPYNAEGIAQGGAA